MKKIFNNLITGLFAVLLVGCDYLDVVPEGTATMDNAFSTRINAEKFFFSCYNYLPNFVNLPAYPGLIGSDEWYYNIDDLDWINNAGPKIVRGLQNSNDPLQNYWDGEQDGKNIFIGIRDCNIFLENIDRVPDLEEYEMMIWRSEVKVVKAYLHFFLLQLYGPIPVIKENFPVNTTPEQTRVFREPVDEVIEYIVELIDEAVPDLMPLVESPLEQNGRFTQSIALAIKAKALVWAASPLFNGNPDYASFVDKRGVHLFSQQYDASKWQRAATAIKNAIDAAQSGGHGFYRYVPTGDALNHSVNRQKTNELRSIITDRFNDEIIWGDTHNTNEAIAGDGWRGTGIAKRCCPAFYSGSPDGQSEVGTTLNMAEMFHTRNGLPIDEDPGWNYDERYDVQNVTGDLAEWHSDYIAENQLNANLNFYREPRFYAWLSFNRAKFETSANADPAIVQDCNGEPQGYLVGQRHIPTGYYVKKLVPTELSTHTNWSNPRLYSYPVIRLADLYLLYAEALNEISGPSEEVYSLLDAIRVRAGIPPIRDAYATAYSNYRNKPYTQDGMREILKRERSIELSFEGQRFFDIRRWKDAAKYLNEPIRGWNYHSPPTEMANYYRVITYLYRTYNQKHYLWPLKISTLTVNSNLVQNPGWEE
jgi:hypothetical protein